jgi:serine/threonine-protein kinase
VSASNDDFLFAQEAQALGYVTEAQVEEAFRLQRIMAQDLKIEERLEGILVKRGWLAEDQARRVRTRIEPEGRKNEIEGYRLLEKLGRGAMGTVYKALHVGLQRIVAIKVLHQDLATDPTQVERLKGEAKLLASLDHPNILRALDAGESNGFPFVVTEYVEGLTLREHLALHGPLPEGDALSITRALADALERARRMGVVHRDVKPGNVLLTRQGQPKLMDLGLAKGPVDLGLTQHGATVGTPQYISPEQAQDPRKADTRSDIYSLGATLYALLTGRPPFEGTTLAEVLTKVLYESPTPPRVLNPKVSAEVGYLIERMMLKDPSLRYHTPAEVVDDIDTILAGRSIMPAGFRGNWEAYLLRRRIRRWSMVGAATLAVALVLGLGVNAWLRQRAESERRESASLLVADTLPVVRWGPSDTRESVEDKRERVRDLLAEVGELDLPEVLELSRVGRDLEYLDECLDKWYALLGGPGEPVPADKGAVVGELLQRGDYRTALERVDGFAREISPPGSQNPVFAKLEEQRDAIRAASLAAWRALESGVRNARPTTLEEWVEVYRRFHAQAARGFVPEPQVSEGVDRAARLRGSAETVLLTVLAHEAAYPEGGVAERLRAGRLGKLFREELPQADQALQSSVAQVWKEEALEATPLAALLGEHGLVSLRVAAVERRVRQQVEDYAAATWRRPRRCAGTAGSTRPTGRSTSSSTSCGWPGCPRTRPRRARRARRSTSRTSSENRRRGRSRRPCSSAGSPPSRPWKPTRPPPCGAPRSSTAASAGSWGRTRPRSSSSWGRPERPSIGSTRAPWRRSPTTRVRGGACSRSCERSVPGAPPSARG